MSKRILIVEDEESIADLEKDYLELSNFEVEVANDGQVGLKKGLEEDFDLIILDLMLPGVDGFDICRQIRDQKNTPIIMVSAKKDDIDKIRGLGLGADDYMTKPFSPNELVARVKAHIQRHDILTNQNEQVIRIKSMEIDTDARSVTVGGENVNLTAKEYDLLLFLAQNPNRAFSKEHLFDRVWGLDALGDVSTVAVHIQRIREKLGIKGEKYIDTVWGVGYRMPK